MKRKLVLFLLAALVAIAAGSCKNDAVTYCPFCGKSGVEEKSVFNGESGLTEISYKCQNDKCGKTFGAGRVELSLIGGL